MRNGRIMDRSGAKCPIGVDLVTGLFWPPREDRFEAHFGTGGLRHRQQASGRPFQVEAPICRSYQRSFPSCEPCLAGVSSTDAAGVVQFAGYRSEEHTSEL